jgi:DNA-binding transcriptional ArsR family regulator
MESVMADAVDFLEDVPILPDTVPVTMPELPLRLSITTVDQFRALSDPVRIRILGVIQMQPATAKQIAERLGATPGAIGHHLHLLEANGLAQVVARRLARGVVAKYYTRTARIFLYELPPEVSGMAYSSSLEIMSHARSEFAEAQSAKSDTAMCFVGFPHVRVSATRAQELADRISALIDELVAEPIDPNGEVYGVCISLFSAPAFLQPLPTSVYDKEHKGG